MAEKTSWETRSRSATAVTPCVKAADPWREFLIGLLDDALVSSDQDHPGAAVVARYAADQFAADEEVTRLARRLLGAREIH